MPRSILVREPGGAPLLCRRMPRLWVQDGWKLNLGRVVGPGRNWLWPASFKHFLVLGPCVDWRLIHGYFHISPLAGASIGFPWRATCCPGTTKHTYDDTCVWAPNSKSRQVQASGWRREIPKHRLLAAGLGKSRQDSGSGRRWAIQNYGLVGAGLGKPRQV